VVTGGTSISSDFVSGIAGLIWSRHPAVANLDIKRIILQSIDPLHSTPETTVFGSRVNARTALL
jgi:hypothetical protein